MKYGLIGCGRIAVNHMKACMNNKFELIAVCDIIEQNARLLLDKFDIEPSAVSIYSDYRRMIDENEFDIISIATDSGMHSEIALFCIQNKINVIIEKPMAMSIEDANKIIELAEKNDVKVEVCHQNRFNTAVQQMRTALESGRFGKISHASVNIRWNRNKEYYEQAKWRGTWTNDGGTLMNQCIHGIDLLNWMCGDEITEVYGQTRRQFHDYIEAEDLGVAIIKFRSGIVATIEGTVNVFPHNLEETLYLFGEKGTVKLGGKSTNNIDIWEFEDENESDISSRSFKEVTSNVYGNGHTALFADMADSIINNRKPYINEYDGKKALEIVLAIYKSQKTGLPVKLPLEDFSSEDMRNEFDEK